MSDFVQYTCGCGYFINSPRIKELHYGMGNPMHLTEESSHHDLKMVSRLSKTWKGIL